MARADHSGVVTPGAPEGEPEASARPDFTQREAADLCGVSFDVIKRARLAGKFPNAYQADDKAGTWRIPVTDLGAAGFSPGRPTPADEPSPIELFAGNVERAAHDAVVAERDRLRIEVAELRGQLAGMTQAVEIARLSLRALPAAPEAPTAPQEPPTAHSGRRRGLLGWMAGSDG
jgi:hypothetical protein